MPSGSAPPHWAQGRAPQQGGHPSSDWSEDLDWCPALSTAICVTLAKLFNLSEPLLIGSKNTFLSASLKVIDEEVLDNCSLAVWGDGGGEGQGRVACPFRSQKREQDVTSVGSTDPRTLCLRAAFFNPILRG